MIRLTVILTAALLLSACDPDYTTQAAEADMPDTAADDRRRLAQARARVGNGVGAWVAGETLTARRRRPVLCAQAAITDRRFPSPPSGEFSRTGESERNIENNVRTGICLIF
jgi:hypothetical protein